MDERFFFIHRNERRWEEVAGGGEGREGKRLHRVGSSTHQLISIMELTSVCLLRRVFQIYFAWGADCIFMGSLFAAAVAKPAAAVGHRRGISA